MKRHGFLAQAFHIRRAEAYGRDFKCSSFHLQARNTNSRARIWADNLVGLGHQNGSRNLINSSKSHCKRAFMIIYIFWDLSIYNSAERELTTELTPVHQLKGCKSSPWVLKSEEKKKLTMTQNQNHDTNNSRRVAMGKKFGSSKMTILFEILHGSNQRGKGI